MKFKLSELYGLTRSLPKLTDKELPIKISYNLLKLMKGISEEMETLEKSRMKLVEKYREPEEEGSKEASGGMKVADEHKDKFQKEFRVLMEEEVDIEFNPIFLKDLGDISFAANDLILLEKIIKEK